MPESPQSPPPPAKNVLLLHQKLLFYRIPIYNKLAALLERNGFHLIVWYPEKTAGGEVIDFEAVERPLAWRAVRSFVRERPIGVVMTFLNRREVGMRFYLRAILGSRFAGSRTVYYGHGLNLNRRHSAFERLISNLILLLYDRIILYSPNEKRYLWRSNAARSSVAFNTLDMEGRNALVAGERASIRRKHGLAEEFIVLFSGRIEPRKRLDALVEAFAGRFRDSAEIGLAIVGPDMPPELAGRIAGLSNVHYFGPVYDRAAMAELFCAADAFCIPGHLGLGIVEALYWGLPIITMTEEHAPEYYYLRDGTNGLVLKDGEDLGEALDRLRRDQERRERMAASSRTTYAREATVDRMLAGYLEALRALP